VQVVSHYEKSKKKTEPGGKVAHAKKNLEVRV
jgi:hypothetical protein